MWPLCFFNTMLGRTLILCLSVLVSVSLFAISLLFFSKFFSISRYHLICKHAYSISTKDFIVA